MRKGNFKIIRCDGTVEDYKEKPTIERIHALLKVDCIDTITLSWHKGTPSELMLVDDTGMIDHKPVNDKATAIMQDLHKGGYPYSIHGDVALVNDLDFEVAA